MPDLSDLKIKGKQIISIVTRICLGILALGILVGLLTEGIAGGIVGFFLAGVIAIPVFCLTNIYKHYAAARNVWDDPTSDVPSSSRNDPFQLPKGAYELKQGSI